MCGLDTTKLMTEQCLLWAILLGIEIEYKENELEKPKRTGHARACQQSC